MIQDPRIFIQNQLNAAKTQVSLQLELPQSTVDTFTCNMGLWHMICSGSLWPRVTAWGIYTWIWGKRRRITIPCHIPYGLYLCPWIFLFFVPLV